MSDQRPATIPATLDRINASWREFRASVAAFPGEYLDARLGEDGWTRKQMLAHISVWHDITSRRLTEFLASGAPVPLAEHEDAVNARAARAAEGRTAGEVVQNLDDSHRRLSRLVGRMTNDDLEAHDGWAVAVIAGNTYDHYAEHRADLDPPHAPAEAGRR